MKLLIYDDYRLGVLKGSQVVDVTGAAPPAIGTPGPLMAQAVMEGVIQEFAALRPRFEEIAAREAGAALSSVKLRPPLFRPSNLLCAFSNYRDREGDPVRGPLDFFHKGGNAVVGCGDVVELPDIPEASVFQPEPELGYVIGRRARRVSEAEALGYVFGYTNFVDVSARDIPNRRTPFFHKALDTWAPMGPVITTA
ncbi:MAG: fumarylacetoacetate hydrolase, partial [Chloroflexi bacterium]|nr:fumarylacetoacetate hydrolase [Chloroflexota bacterium]